MFTVHRQDGCSVLQCQLTDQFTSNDQCFLVSQTDGLMGLDGMNGWRETCEAHHSSEHHIDGACLNNLVEGTCSCIHLHVRHIAHQRLQLVVACLVGNDDGSRLELVGLLCQQFHLVIGCQAVHLVEVAVLLNHFEGLRAYASC